MADVPLGMFLSGGLDSSAIAALMARMIDRPLQTFSVAFEQRAFSELGYARQVSTAIGADAHEVVIDDHDFFGALPRLVWHEDEPIAHPSSVPLYFVSRLASEHVKVVLTGEGSDELLAGYGKYPARAGQLAGRAVSGSVAPEPLRRVRADTVVPAAARRARRATRTRSFLAMPRTPEAMFFDNFAAIGLRASGVAARRRASRGSRHRSRAYARVARLFRRADRGQPTLDRLLYTDIKTYLVELLMKQDQMSMAASIESRVPFLDHQLVEFARAPDANEAARADHEVDPARGGQGTSCRARFSRGRRWASRCRSRCGCGGRGRTWPATCSSIGAAASAASSIRALGELIDAHAAGTGVGGRRHLGPAQPGTLVPHVRRRRRNPNIVDAVGRCTAVARRRADGTA